MLIGVAISTLAMILSYLRGDLREVFKDSRGRFEWGWLIVVFVVTAALWPVFLVYTWWHRRVRAQRLEHREAYLRSPKHDD